MMRYRLAIAALVLAAVAIAAPAARAAAQEKPSAAPAVSQPHETAAGQETSGAEHAEEHDAGWKPTIAKAVNFAILAGILVYFLRSPLSDYLNGRITRVRQDLVTASQTRQTAERQLAEIDAKLKGLPAEIEALKQRGAEDLVAERARIAQAAESERQRLLEHTRREIDMRLRIAKRELLELGADLAVGVASDRIRGSITPEDQARMVDRYASQLGPRGARS